MAQLLKLAQFAHGDGMPQVQVAGAWIETTINPSTGGPLLGFHQALAQFVRHSLLKRFIAVFRSLHQVSYLFIDA